MSRAAWALAVVLTAAGAARAQQSPVGPEPSVIYGNDDRLDLYQVQDGRVRALAGSTVGLFQASDVTVDAGKAKLATQPYGATYGLCKTEPFYEQGSGAFCSGSLVAPGVVMTAGHCVTDDESCANTKFVFGFGIPKEGADPTSVPASEVYGCGKLLGRAQNNTGADWALVKLDRPVAGHPVLKLDRDRQVSKDDLLFVVGHPAGLPTKVAGGAKVRDASPDGFFVANLDTYGGNSGSAVFNAATGLVVGILVRGEQDFVEKNGCRVSNVCPADGCRGEDVTKIGSVGFPTGGLSALAPASRVALPPTMAALLQLQEAAARP